MIVVSKPVWQSDEIPCPNCRLNLVLETDDMHCDMPLTVFSVVCCGCSWAFNVPVESVPIEVHAWAMLKFVRFNGDIPHGNGYKAILHRLREEIMQNVRT